MAVDDRARAETILRAAVLDMEVTLIEIDFRVTLDSSEGQTYASITLETPFRLSSESGLTEIDPSEIKTVPPVLGVLRRHLRRAWVDHDSTLSLEFDDGHSISAPCHPDFESWSMVASDGSRVICAPGGHLLYWSADPKDRRVGGHDM